MSDAEQREEFKKLVKQAMREQMPQLLEEYKIELDEPEWLKALKLKWQEETNMKECVDCGRKIVRSAKYCSHCGEEVEE